MMNQKNKLRNCFEDPPSSYCLTPVSDRAVYDVIHYDAQLGGITLDHAEKLCQVCGRCRNAEAGSSDQ